MPLVNLEPGQSIELNPTPPKDPDYVRNDSCREGAYVMTLNLEPLAIQYHIAPGQTHYFTVQEGGLEIRNDGDVSLTVKTPGL